MTNAEPSASRHLIKLNSFIHCCGSTGALGTVYTSHTLMALILLSKQVFGFCFFNKFVVCRSLFCRVHWNEAKVIPLILWVCLPAYSLIKSYILAKCYWTMHNEQSRERNNGFGGDLSLSTSTSAVPVGCISVLHAASVTSTINCGYFFPLSNSHYNSCHTFSVFSAWFLSIALPVYFFHWLSDLLFIDFIHSHSTCSL